MIIQIFYNYEEDVVKKSKHFTIDIPLLAEKILGDHPATIRAYPKTLVHQL